MSGAPSIPKTVKLLHKEIVQTVKRLIVLESALVGMVIDKKRTLRGALADALDDADDGKRSQKALVLEHFIRIDPETSTPAEVAKAVGCTLNAARVYCHEHEKAKMLIRVSYGVYRAVTEADEDKGEW